MKFPFYINTNHKLENTILVAGTGRSGTTWLGDIINYKNEYRIMFEPFASKYVKECNHFNYKQYIRPDSKAEYFLKESHKILSGNIKNQWIDRYNRKFFCNHRLVKEIRANFFLKWIKNNFPSIPIIFIIRHPCAVAHSRIKLGWETYLEDILDQKDLIQDYLSDYQEDFRNIHSNFEKQIYLWCIENYVTLKQLKKGDAHFIFYEPLCLNPTKTIQRLFNWLGKEYDKAIEKVIKTPSSVSRKQSAIVTGDDLIGEWKKNIHKEQIVLAMKIIEKFGLDALYNESTRPKVEKVESVLFP